MVQGNPAYFFKKCMLQLKIDLTELDRTTTTVLTFLEN